MPAFRQRKLLESEVAVNPAQAGTPCGEVLIEEQSRAIDGSVAVEFDRPLQILQRLDRSVERLLSNRIVEPGRGILGIQRLGQGELAGRQRIASLFEIGLPEVAA